MVSGSFQEYVLDQLGDLGDVTARAMFGGVGLYLGETFFAILYDDRFYLKVDDATRPRYEQAGMGPFQPNERQTMASYHEVPADVLEDPDQAAVWARQAVEVARQG